MSHQLPTLFDSRMKDMLVNQYKSFTSSYELPAWQGLRINPLKVASKEFLCKQVFPLRQIPWCAEGFYYTDNVRPGKHPFHAAGLYYLQEPSAMAVAQALDIQPGDSVLDLCAAPGGKSTQIAGKLMGKGLLIANEIHPTRAKALSENIERLGVTNAIVTNETPDRLAERFPSFFDHVLVDAPCSGEGMFRKLPEAIDDWSMEKVTECHLMQKEILDAAASMLKPGGTLVYSTCTFAPLENEQTIAEFLQSHPSFHLVPVAHAELFSPGQAKWVNQPTEADLSKTVRLWPHLLEGEGHFIAKLVKQQDEAVTEQKSVRDRKKGKVSSSTGSPSRKEAEALWQAFARNALSSTFPALTETSAFTLFGEQLYYSPAPYVDWNGIKVVRAGWHLGMIKKNRFEPSHALALAMQNSDVLSSVDFSADSPEILRYLKGETLFREGGNGWVLITVDCYSLGWGKRVDGSIKNHYPKGLRWL